MTFYFPEASFRPAIAPTARKYQPRITSGVSPHQTIYVSRDAKKCAPKDT
jgi:hypothetical protein